MKYLIIDQTVMMVELFISYHEDSL